MMGTRRSRHNYGRKPEGGHDQTQANCALCFTPVFVAARKYNRKRNVLCSKCARGDTPAPVIIAAPSRAELDGGKADFLRCDEVKTLQLSAVMAMTAEEVEQVFEHIRFSASNGRPECTSCGSSNLYKLDTRRKWRCKRCEHEFSATSGTIFASRKLHERFYLAAMALLYNGRNDKSLLKIGAELGCQYTTIYNLAIELRSAMTLTSTGRDLIPPEKIKDPPNRYIDGMFMNNGRQWTVADQANLVALCNQGTSIEKSAAALGRPPRNLHSRANDLGIKMPPSWAAIVPARPRKLIVREPKIVLQYPYIQKPRAEHADILAINALVPKTLSPDVRADICQEIMVAMFEGTVTLEDLEKNRGRISWFIRKFYKDNAEDSGRAVSLSGSNPDDDREYYDIAASISKKDWDWEQLNQSRLVHGSYVTHTPAAQFGAMYNNQVDRLQRQAHEHGDFVEREELERRLDDGETMLLLKASPQKVAATVARITQLLSASGVSIANVRNPVMNGAVYIEIDGEWWIRVSDHPPLSARTRDWTGDLQDEQFEFDWRVDLGVGFNFKKLAYKSIEALVDSFLLRKSDFLEAAE